MAKKELHTEPKSESQRAVEAAQARAREAEAKMAEYEAQLKKAEELASKGLSLDALKQVAGKHASPEQLKLLERLQRIAEKEDSSVGDVLSHASELGDMAGMTEQQKKWLKALTGNAGQAVDLENAAKVPGLVVDKDTGKISVLGLFELDAKDSTSKIIANGVAGAYNLFAVNANELGFRKVYEAASKAASRFDMLAASNQRIGFAAACAAVGLTSFWPDVIVTIQQQKKDRKQLMAVANRFAPLLDSYMPDGASRIAKFYRVDAATNQMIVNERRRLGQNSSAEHFKNVIEMIGRGLPLFAASIAFGGKAVGLTPQQAEVESAIAQKSRTAANPEEAKLNLIKEKADLFQEKLGLERKDAVDKAWQWMEGAGETLAEPIGFLGKLKRDITSGGVIAAAPIAGMVARNLYNKRLKDYDIQPISAADMVDHLGRQIDEDPRAERFTLPKGMTELGSKTGNNQLKLEAYLEQIFRQHERDTHGSDALIPARFDEALHSACKLIAAALREGKVDGRIALFKLVGEQLVVRSGGKFVADTDMVQDVLVKLEQEIRYLQYVDKAKYFAESSFTPEDLKQSWNAMDAQERDMFAMLVPAQVLESVGVDPAQLQAMRERRQEHFRQDMKHLCENMLRLDEKTLKEAGLTRQEKTLLRDVASQLGSTPEEQAHIGSKALSKASHVLANVLVAANTQHVGTLAQQQMGTHKA